MNNNFKVLGKIRKYKKIANPWVLRNLKYKEEFKKKSGSFLLYTNPSRVVCLDCESIMDSEYYKSKLHKCNKTAESNNIYNHSSLIYEYNNVLKDNQIGVIIEDTNTKVKVSKSKKDIFKLTFFSLYVTEEDFSTLKIIHNEDAKLLFHKDSGFQNLGNEVYISKDMVIYLGSKIPFISQKFINFIKNNDIKKYSIDLLNSLYKQDIEHGLTDLSYWKPFHNIRLAMFNQNKVEELFSLEKTNDLNFSDMLLIDDLIKEKSYELNLKSIDIMNILRNYKILKDIKLLDALLHKFAYSHIRDLLFSAANMSEKLTLQSYQQVNDVMNRYGLYVKINQDKGVYINSYKKMKYVDAFLMEKSDIDYLQDNKINNFKRILKHINDTQSKNALLTYTYNPINYIYYYNRLDELHFNDIKDLIDYDTKLKEEDVFLKNHFINNELDELLKQVSLDEYKVSLNLITNLYTFHIDLNNLPYMSPTDDTPLRGLTSFLRSYLAIKRMGVYEDSFISYIEKQVELLLITPLYQIINDFLLFSEKNFQSKRVFSSITLMEAYITNINNQLLSLKKSLLKNNIDVYDDIERYVTECLKDIMQLEDFDMILERVNKITLLISYETVFKVFKNQGLTPSEMLIAFKALYENHVESYNFNKACTYIKDEKFAKTKLSFKNDRLFIVDNYGHELEY